VGLGVLPEPDAERGPAGDPFFRQAPEFHRDLKIARSLALSTLEFYQLPEAEQELQIGAHELEQGLCHQHGGPYDECADPKREWYPQRTVCHAAMEAAAANWRYDDLHEKAPYHDGAFTSWAKTRSLSHPYHARDGVSVWVAQADLNPTDAFLDPQR
jgi:hypothetical protein